MGMGSAQLAALDQVSQLAQITMAPGQQPVVVRNNLRGIVTFTDENTKISTTWAAKGDPAGGDIKEVSPTILHNPQFREQLLRGIFEIDQREDTLAHHIQASQQAWLAKQQQAQQALAEIETSQAQVVATGQPCIAPKAKGELCGSYQIVMGTEDTKDKPPLCAEHAHLAPFYKPVETGRQDPSGAPEVIWKRGA